jgi:hypothetical protein
LCIGATHLSTVADNSCDCSIPTRTGTALQAGLCASPGLLLGAGARILFEVRGSTKTSSTSSRNEYHAKYPPALHFRAIAPQGRLAIANIHERAKAHGTPWACSAQCCSSVQGRMLRPTPMTCRAPRLMFSGANGCRGLPVGTSVVPMFPATCPIPKSSAKCGCSFCVMRTA